MAYVHMSVNQRSGEYLANERRYNYTTPKSFLEQIKLYGSLLGQKSKDLTTKMERLENGLQKLNSTSAQVQSRRVNPAPGFLHNVPYFTLNAQSIMLHTIHSVRGRDGSGNVLLFAANLFIMFFFPYFP